MAINVVNLGDSLPAGIDAPDFESSTDATSYANASWTPPTADNSVVLLWVYNTKATTVGVAGTVTGNGLTWTLQASNAVDPGAQTHRLTLYAAISTGTASAGQTTVDYAGVTQSGIIMMFQQVTGVDLTGALAGVIIQQPTNTTSSANSLAANLSAASDADNRFMAGVGHGQPEGASAEAGWDEIDDWGGSSPGRALLVMWDTDSVADTSPTVSWTTAGAAVAISIELVAAPETNQTYEDSVTIGKVLNYIASAQMDMQGSTSLANVKGLTPSAQMDMQEAQSLGSTKGIVDSATMDMFQDLALGALKAIQDSAQLDFNPTIGFQVAEGVDVSIIGTMNLTLGLGKLVSVSVIEQTVALVTKGFVVTLDFATNPVTIRDFRANTAGTDDFAGTHVEGSDS
jgi:hypothetical protein